MASATAHDDVLDLIAAVRDRPTDFPIAELAKVRAHRIDVSITRSAGESVALVTPRRDPVFDELTPREHEVATLVCAGYSNAQVASTLFVSLATTKDHVHAILGKTGLGSRAQLIVAWYGGATVGPPGR